MEEITKMLENWKNMTPANRVFTKDYSIENDYVNMIISVSVEECFLFKSFTAKCHLNKQEIENAIDMLEEKKDELI